MDILCLWGLHFTDRHLNVANLEEFAFIARRAAGVLLPKPFAILDADPFRTTAPRDFLAVVFCRSPRQLCFGSTILLVRRRARGVNAWVFFTLYRRVAAQKVEQ